MNIQLNRQPAAAIAADALVVPVFEGPLTGQAAALDQTAQGLLSELQQAGEWTGKAQELLVTHRPAGLAAKRLVLAGCGKPEKWTAAQFRMLVGAAARLLKGKQAHTIALVLDGPFAAPEFATAAVEGALLSVWEGDEYKTDPNKGKCAVNEFTVIVPDGAADLSAAVALGETLAAGQNFARDLANEPPNVLTPVTLAERARQMAEAEGLSCDVLDRARMEQLGMGSLLGVAMGSAEPPTLTVIRYTPENPAPDAPHLALIGKAVTFDTGGISIKPAENMDKMKFDMAGGAAVIGAMQAIARLKPRVPVTAYIPSTENMPGGKAMRPGDILKSLSGKTIEVLNTDAEGRLILVDAITYAKQNGATHLVNAATLTGAIVVALGGINTGVFSNNDAWQSQVLSASKTAGEKMWALPMDDEYREMLKSNVADVPNIGARGAGSITAAMFLRDWVDETPWVHLDIAGTAWLDDAKPYMAKGPTGVAMRTFVHLAMAL